jgi:hypothetical protein
LCFAPGNAIPRSLSGKTADSKLRQSNDESFAVLPFERIGIFAAAGAFFWM